MMCGGPSEAQPADEEIQDLILTIKDRSEETANRTYEKFVAVEFKSQVVAGTNYFVKIQVSDSEYIHVRIFKPLPHVNGLPKLSGQQLGKSKDDALEYFDA